MHILMLCESFPPETKSASTLFYELASSFVEEGHKVTFITRKPRANIAYGTNLENIPKREDCNGIDVIRMTLPSLPRNIPLVRGLDHFILSIVIFFRGIFIKKPNIILVYSPPLPLGICGYWLSFFKKCFVIVNIQDLFPQAVIDLELLKNNFLINISRRMEKFIYRKISIVTVHSEGNKKYIIDNGGQESRIKVVHNWVDTNFITPGKKENKFSNYYNIKDKFVVSFAGVMGYPQGLEVVIKCANMLRHNENIMFLLIGDGVKRKSLEDLASNLALKNVKFIQTQPYSIYPLILHSSDVGLVTLLPQSTTPVVPGKMFSIMAAGIPVITSLPLSGDAPKIITKNQCGICVEPGNPQALADAVEKLYNNEEMRKLVGRNGRNTAEQFFSRTACISVYNLIFKELKLEK